MQKRELEVKELWEEIYFILHGDHGTNRSEQDNISRPALLMQY
jgi:hypothetical protein